MKVALAQISPILGDFFSNYKVILQNCIKAHQQKCDLIIFPEAALFGYYPADLLERPSTVKEQEKYLKQIEKNVPPDLFVLVGALVNTGQMQGKPFFNGAALIKRGKKTRFFPKKVIPNYDVFDESRHIESPTDKKNNFVSIKGFKILVTVCEDMWVWPEGHSGQRSPYKKNFFKEIKARPDLILNLSASPFTMTKSKKRFLVAHKTATYFQAPLFYVNQVGGQDELIFDGGSFVLDKKGQLLCQCPYFKEHLQIITLHKDQKSNKAILNIPKILGNKPLSVLDQIQLALPLGIKDFVHKTGFQKVHLGLSGGIDSAVVACLAVLSLGSENVTALALPGPYNLPNSLNWAKILAENLNIKFQVLPITEMYHQTIQEMERLWGELPFGLLHENVQARLRGLLLMAFANKESSLLLNTSNKSELAVGYSTLYGDLCGGLSPIGDLLKTQVYSLAHHLNKNTKWIPHEIIDRPPSAELRENQTDQDTLPPYELLDRAVDQLVVKRKSAHSQVEKFVLQSLYQSEFKRWQAPPILKVSDHAFGRGRRFPMAHRCRS